jgi:hypothetical protein
MAYRWRNEYAAKYPDIKKSRLGLQFAHCKLCAIDIKIGYGGLGAIACHCSSSKHAQRVKVDL